MTAKILLSNVNLKVLKEYEEGKDKVFVLRDIVEIRIPRKKYEELLKKFSKEHIVSFSEDKRVVNRITRRELVFVTRESGIPLIGHSAFGIIDRGTNLLQVRCMTGCNLNCIFCSVDEGKESKTRKTDFIVDPDYMIEVLRKFVEFKGDNVEVHLDGQGEPALYPYLTYFVEKLKDLKVETVSMQTNGTVLSEKIIDKLEGNMTRINLSISALSEEKAKILHGKNYPLKHVLNIAETIANSKIDLLIAPVWVPDYNDDEIPKIIEFALEIGAGKKFPPLGIQKYIPYRFGRKLKKSMSFKEFYEKLSKLEKEYGIKLILRPEDFNMEKRPKYPNPFKKGDIERGKIVSEGRMVGEKLVVARGRSVAVYTKKKVGEFVEFEVVSAKDNIIVGVEK